MKHYHFDPARHYRTKRRRSVLLAAMALLLLSAVLLPFATPAQAQATCGVTTQTIGNGTIATSADSDPSLSIEIAPGNDYVIMENSVLKVEFDDYFENHLQFSIREFRHKPTNTNHVGGQYLNASAGRGAIKTVTLVDDAAGHKTLRFVWANANNTPDRDIIQDITIYANQPFIEIDYVDTRWGLNIVDLGAPGGTSAGKFDIYGADTWVRGYVTHVESPETIGSYYNRYPGDNVNDPIDAGSLNYNDHLVMTVYRELNGRGFGRTNPVIASDILKLLLNAGQHNGFELFPYPFFRPTPAFKSYLFAFDDGPTEGQQLGQALADGLADTLSGGDECGEDLTLQAIADAGWDFVEWQDDVVSTNNPVSLTLTAQHTVTAVFAEEPPPPDVTAPQRSNEQPSAGSPVAPVDSDITLHITDGNSGVDDSTIAMSVNGSGVVPVVSGNSADYLLTYDPPTDFTLGDLITVEVDACDFAGNCLDDSYSFTIGEPTTSFASDDFDSCVIDESLWSVVNPLSDGTVVMNGSSVSLGLPAGVAHVISGSNSADFSNNTLQLLQPTLDEDFELEVKFDSAVPDATTSQGVIIKEDGDTLLHIDLRGRINQTRLYIAKFTDGAKYQYYDKKIGNGSDAPLWLRVNRSGGTWRVYSSIDGTNFTLRRTVNTTLTVTQLGLQISNEGTSPNNAPAFTSQVDYFYNTLAPGAGDSDGSSLTVNTLGNGSVALLPNQADYACGDLVSLTAEPAIGNILSAWSGSLSGNATNEAITIMGQEVVTATFIPTTPFSVTLAAVGNGTATVDPVKNGYLYGETITLTAMADAGHLLSGWIGNLSGTASPTTYVITGTTEITATFAEIVFHDLTLNTVGNGTVQQDPSGTSFETGSVVTVTASADSGWQFAGYSGDLSSNNPVEQITLFDDAVVTATFTLIPTYTVSATVVGNGTVLVTPDQPSYQAGTVVIVTATADPAWMLEGWSGDLSGTATSQSIASASDLTFTATFTENSEIPAFEIWYGDNQTFGQPGVPQRWVNVLGTVSNSNHVTSLSFTVNGGSSSTLSIGPDQRRLVAAGDFNIEIDYADLQEGANTIVITAVADNSPDVTKTVIVTKDTSTPWPLPDSASWGSVVNLQDVVQVIDGRWQFDANGIRTSNVAYDRVLAIGEQTWTDYEVVVPITVHSADFAGANQPTSVAPGIGMTLRWTGHTNNPINCSQPHCGWLPNGGSPWYDFGNNNGTFFIGGDSGFVDLDTSGAKLTLGATYIWKARVETVPTGTEYSFKLWVQGQPEPASWFLSGIVANDHPAGSFLIVAHHVDATVGDFTVTDLNQTQYTLAASVNGSGTLSVDPDQPFYDPGDLVTVTVSADSGHSFTGWNGDASGSDNPLVLTMDANKTVVATVTADAPSPYSDEFNAPTLDPKWTWSAGISGDPVPVMSGTAVQISVPAATDHGIWTNGTFASRIMQPIPDEDFTLDVRFDSLLQDTYQSQGVLIEGNDGSVLRIETYSAGSNILLFAAHINSTTATTFGGFGTAIVPTGTTPLDLRIARVGDDWVVSYSTDGVNFSSPNGFAFNQPFSVTSMGLYAGNTHDGGNSAPAFTASVDYFRYSGATQPNDSFTVSATAAAGGSVAVDPVQATYALNDIVVVTATADLGYAFDGWSGSVVSSDNPLVLSVSADMTVTATFTPTTQTSSYSDDFNSAQLDAKWSWTAGLSGDLPPTFNGTSMTLDVPSGHDHAIWSNGWATRVNVSRITQSIPDEDFLLDVKFDAGQSGDHQMQGVIAEASDGSLVRIELFSDGGDVYMHAAHFDQGNVTTLSAGAQQLYAAGSVPAYLRVARSGDSWTLSYSLDGTNFTVPNGMQFSHAVTLDGIGVYAGNGSADGNSAPAFAAAVDHFYYNGPPPAVTHSLTTATSGAGSIAVQPNASSFAANSVVTLTATADAGHSFTGWSGDLSGSANPATLLIDGDKLVTATFTALPTYTLSINVVGGGVVTATPDLPSYVVGDVVTLTVSADSGYSFTAWSGDLSGSSTSETITMDANKTVTATFTAAPSGGPFSDEFNALSLNPGWTWIAGDGSDSAPALDGSGVELAIPAGIAHDIWTSGVSASRLMQSADNVNFELETKFESGVSVGYQTQGILVEDASGNLIRIELNSNGSNTRIFILTILNGTATPIGGWGRTIAANGQAPMYLRVVHSADLWTVYYSSDGTNWQTRPEYSFTFALNVDAFGIYAGNADSGGAIPAHTMRADYFRYTLLP